MPEGPEICITAQYLNTKINHRIVHKMEIISGKYLKKDLAGKDILDGNTQYVIDDIKSKGKILWFELYNKADKANKLYIISQFGLTGEWGFHKNNGSRIRLIVSNVNDDKKYNLYYSDDRNFGNIIITNNRQVLQNKIDQLAPDFLQQEYDDNTFKEWFKNFVNKTKARGKMILGVVLMHQKTSDGLGSGIGNYLASEIMYDAHLSPHRTLNSLTDAEILKLGHSIRYMMKLSYYNNTTGYMTHFDEFIPIHKKGIDTGIYPNFQSDINLADKAFEFKVYRKKHDPFGNPVKHDTTVNNKRTTHWVPKTQT